MGRLGFLALAALLLVVACVAPVGKGKPAPNNPITGGEIATTSLDSPSGKPALSVPKPMPRPDAGKVKPSEAELVKPDAPKPEAAKPLPPPLSPEGQACLKKGGIWGKAGRGLGNTCVLRTKDSGKSCQRSSQCEGDCLARSQTCAPYTPLFGCNAILQDNGLEVTLCID